MDTIVSINLLYAYITIAYRLTESNIYYHWHEIYR